jgi:choline kinase
VRLSEPEASGYAGKGLKEINDSNSSLPSGELDQESRVKIDVVVLMAGRGRRLLPLTKDRPKAILLCEDGMSIFEHIVRSFLTCNWEPTFIPVIGHGRLKVYEELDRLASLARYAPVMNPFYASAGPLVSLWLGLLQSKNDKVVILNGDTLIRGSLVADLARWILKASQSDRPGVGVCVTPAVHTNPDDMKIKLSKNGLFRRAGKDIAPGANVVKSAGVIAVKRSACKAALLGELEELLMEGDGLRTGFYWHNILNEIKSIFEINLIEVEPGSWYEVDTNFDLYSINEA